MTLLTIIFGCVLAVFSAAILSYISIATMVGPWIAPTLVLITSLFFKLRKKATHGKAIQEIILIQSIAAGGGIIAVGIGFTLPILYFLAPDTFNTWLKDQFNFWSVITSTCLSAGCLGIVLGRVFSQRIIHHNNLPFPVSQLTYKAATSQTHKQQGFLFLWGTLSALCTSFLRDGLYSFQGIIPKNIHLFQQWVGKELTVSVWPTLWAIGYTTGIHVAIPLLVGVASKYLILNPINYHSDYLSYALFEPFDHLTFATAFCSGLVLTEVTLGIAKQATTIKSSFYNYFASLVAFKSTIKTVFTKATQRTSFLPTNTWHQVSIAIAILEPIAALTSSFFLFSYLEFSFLALLVFLFLTIAATYEICFIGCEIGLVQFGRFSVFVLIPMILLFKINYVQITAVCVFFNICAATASDLLFDYKTGSYCEIEKPQMHIAQWIGLMVTSLSIGLILHLLFTQLELGSAELFAHRGRSKALLITSLNFNYYVVASGALYGFLLKRFNISPTMTLGGIIMPNNITLGLVFGGIVNYITRKRHTELLPFFSGIFASETLWIILTLLLKIF